MIADDIKDFAGSLIRMQSDTAKAAHDARQPEVDRLKAVIKLLLPYAVPADVDLHKADCRCAYHQGAAAVRVTKAVTHKRGVYGEWCRDPDLCADKGYCPRDPNCGD